MRRILAGMVILAAVSGLVALLTGAAAQGSSDYRFDVIFDDARGLIPGQVVKIAGANAGTISDVGVTPNFKARVSASVPGRFAPFHQNATCTIRPEGLIAENYVDCDPGNADSPPLQARGGQPPTVPVNRTSEPVSLLDLFNIFNLPTRERFMVLIDELGMGTAGEGGNINDVIRRANPSLALARQVISILDRQRAQLATLVDATNTVAAEAAGHPATVQAFLDRSAALTRLLAAHRDSLSQSIARLPGMLQAAGPALQQLDTVARSGTPLLGQLRAAAPALNQVAADIGPFAAAAKPGLASLDRALNATTPALRQTTPLVKTLNTYLKRSLSSTELMGRLFTNLQRTGFPENLLSVFYYTTAATSRYDTFSHILPAFLISPNNGACGSFATKPVPGCSAHYGQGPTYQRPAAASDHRGAPAAASTHPAVPAAGSGTATTGSPPPGPPRPHDPVTSTLQSAKQIAGKVVSKLLSGAGTLTANQAKQLQSLLQSGGNQPPSQDALKSLTSYLLR